ncbi:MAG TPA: PorP/SprF family type IX secretion system membrane protein [Phnomibacter sp.]|nr:PorP/SprF family type IX secretion system membrane protein [Phnomibacter sp.]
MKRAIKKHIILLAAWILATVQGLAQDPNFAQFFSSPLNVNPALTAHINADWRVISNLRNQWAGPANPYLTGTISFDAKLFQNKMWRDEEGNRFGIGTMVMYDQAFANIVKSTYISQNISYNVVLHRGTNSTHRLGAGFGAIWGRRMVDFGRLTWEEQFVGNGFNTNLPTGEVALSNMKPYISITGGLLYNVSGEKSNFDLGVASFHINEPKQTFLEDPNQDLARRNVVHSNFETLLNEELVLNMNAIYQFQREATYYSFGGALGYFLPGANRTILNAGLWYWSENALIPYIGIALNEFQFGFTYDLTISKLRDAPRQPNSFEFSLIYRGSKSPERGLPCPWR